MQKTTSTILIAFLSGIVLAGGTAYLISSVHKSETPQAAVAPSQPAQTAPTSQPGAATTPDASQAATPAATQPEPPAAEPAQPAREEVRRKPRPGVERASRPNDETDQASEASAAPQPTAAEVAQNAPPAQPAQPTSAPQPAEPPHPNQALNPPADTQAVPPPPPQPKSVTLTAGTPITVRINEKLSTNTNYAGDTFTASLEKPIIVDGYIIADRGSRVIGKVLKADKAGRVKGLADLSLALTQIHTTDGQTVAIQTGPWDKEGPTAKKRDAAEVAGGAALGAIIGAIAGGGKGAAIGAGAGGAAGTGAVLTTRGKPAEIASETLVTFSLNNDVPITEHLSQ